ncbi:MAG: hemolysin III family protein [Deltaproteobacteria bacterium]|nr:hemolysin III family protein [Deltaproteobacteria bacterium]
MSGDKTYPPAEERLNIASHAAGLAASLVGLVLLLRRAWPAGNARLFLSAAVYGFSLVALYAASTLYHATQDPARRRQAKILDHAAIYLLIAGTYTPFTLITLHGPTGWTIFAVSWSLALVGVGLKLFFTGRFRLLSTAMYLFMGWIIVFAIGPLTDRLSAAGLRWLVAGGVAYTVGALLYSCKSIRFTHALFHLFVLAGSFCHFVAVYRYVLPAG